MRKKLLAAIALSIVLSLGLIGVAWGSESLTTNAAADGSWQVNTKAGSYLTKSEKSLFDKATRKLVGASYTPVAVLAKQVVAGTNYAYFCKAKTATANPKTSWKVVVVYKNLKGKAKVIAVNNFNCNSISTLKKPASTAGMAGAWTCKSYTGASKGIPKAAQSAIDKAKKKYKKVSLTPLALLSSQVVAGKNYRFLCSGKASDSSATFYAVDVYQDLKGAAKITSCKPINMSKYLKH